jgi:multifunctional 2-oxoglutarate metabolism enzyme
MRRRVSIDGRRPPRPGSTTSEEKTVKRSMTDQETSSKQFGTNMWLVDEMYADYLANPDSVSESWKEFFSDYKPTSGTGTSAGGQRPERGGDGGGPAQPKPTAKPDAKADAGAGGRRRGGSPPTRSPCAASRARHRGEHGESLGVPTATSIRTVPAKLLEVNRRIINNQLARTRGGKVSFTHLIGWAIVRAMAACRS